MWNVGHNSSGYIVIYKPNHPLADSQGYILEHRLVYEEYYNCCLLSWSVIHHKNGLRDDNRIENLRGMTRKSHQSHHSKADGRKPPGSKPIPDDRKCDICGGKSYKRQWFMFGEYPVCKSCGRKIIYHI